MGLKFGYGISYRYISVTLIYEMDVGNEIETLYLLGMIPHLDRWPSLSTSHADQCPGTPLYMVLSMYKISSFWNVSCDESFVSGKRSNIARTK